MSEKTPNKLVPSKGGFIEELSMRVKLIIRLMTDKRVSLWLKLIPVGSVVYLLNPIDIPGPLDDAAIFGLGMYMFIELCPPDIVEDHMKQLRNVVFGEINQKTDESNVVEGEFKEIFPDESHKDS
jgi:hypothetical protein